METNYRYYTGIAPSMGSRDIYEETDQIRTEQELVETEKEFFDKTWYVRHLNRMAKDGRVSSDPTICRDAECAAQRVQRMYGNVQEWLPRNDYELGYLHGTFAAVRWALGCEWGFLDT